MTSSSRRCAALRRGRWSSVAKDTPDQFVLKYVFSPTSCQKGGGMVIDTRGALETTSLGMKWGVILGPTLKGGPPISECVITHGSFACMHIGGKCVEVCYRNRGNTSKLVFPPIFPGVRCDSMGH